MLIFNKGGCPVYDHGDTAFLGRLLVTPMRARFDKDVPAEPEESYTYEADPVLEDVIARQHAPEREASLL